MGRCLCGGGQRRRGCTEMGGAVLEDTVTFEGGVGAPMAGCRPHGCGRQAYRDVFTASRPRKTRSAHSRWCESPGPYYLMVWDEG